MDDLRIKGLYLSMEFGFGWKELWENDDSFS
jgi:hypothetical protein